LERLKHLLSDYHVHTPYCGHANGKIINYIESAIALGMPEIGFSDHLGRYYLGKEQKKRYWDWGMNERDLSRYFSELMDLKEVYEDRIKIRIGLEIDYIEGAEYLAEEIISRYPFDYLLGSIHCLPSLGWRHISQYVKVDPQRTYYAYFNAINSAIKSKIFQSIAHIDFIWRYIPWQDVPFYVIEDFINITANLAFQNNCCIEVNANAYLWSKIENFNNYDLFNCILNSVKKYNTNITLGSDAHTPELVGKAFPQIIALIKKNDIKFASYFDQKELKKVVID